MMLTVRHIRHWYEPKLPHAVFINGFFAIWLVRLVVIRKTYYKMSIS